MLKHLGPRYTAIAAFWLAFVALSVVVLMPGDLTERSAAVAFAFVLGGGTLIVLTAISTIADYFRKGKPHD